MRAGNGDTDIGDPYPGPRDLGEESLVELGRGGRLRLRLSACGPSSTLATVNRPFPSKWGLYQATLPSRIHPCGGDFSACCLHAQRPSTLVTASRWQPRSAPHPYCASRQVLAWHLVFSFTVLSPLFFQFHPFAGGLAACCRHAQWPSTNATAQR